MRATYADVSCQVCLTEAEEHTNVLKDSEKGANL